MSETLFGAVDDEATAAVGSGQDVRRDGVTDEFFHGIAHRADAQAWVEAFQDEEFEDFVAFVLYSDTRSVAAQNLAIKQKLAETESRVNQLEERLEQQPAPAPPTASADIEGQKEESW